MIEKEIQLGLNKLKEDPELWDIFTRKEEYNPILLDRYDRFQYYLSQYRSIFNPLVSEFLIRNGAKIEFPNGKQFAVCITHDVEFINLSKKRTVYMSLQQLRKFHVKQSLKLMLSKMKKKYNSLRNFTHIMNLEQKFDAKSTFFFLALEQGEQDYNYSIKDVNSDLKSIIKRGWEVALHGGHTAYNNAEQMKIEKTRLEEGTHTRVIGYRGHYQKFRVPLTWEYLLQSGFKYDSTFGYPDCVGFRNGMCHPFEPYNLHTNKFIDILEIPLAIVDGCLGDTYMRLNPEQSWNIVKLLIDTVKKYRGVITILLHTVNLAENSNWAFYQKILQYCTEQNAWLASGEQIYDWYKR